MLFFSNSNAAVVCDFIGFKGICFTIGMNSLKQENRVWPRRLSFPPGRKAFERKEPRWKAYARKAW